MKERTDKLYFIKIKSVYSEIDSIKSMNIQAKLPEDGRGHPPTDCYSLGIIWAIWSTTILRGGGWGKRTSFSSKVK